VAANTQTKAIDLGCESAENWQLPSTSTIAIVIITQSQFALLHGIAQPLFLKRQLKFAGERS